jgi:hypothetical protein
LGFGYKIVLSYHLGKGIKDVGEEHHGKPLFFVASRTVTALTTNSAIIFAATFVVKGQKLEKNVS